MSSHFDFSPDTDSRLERSVLVVDDENPVRDLMSRWLEAGGYAVSSAAGADEALGLMESFPSAVALCDIRMPGRDGLWLVDRIRRAHPETAVIIATGVLDVDAATASLRQGVIDFLMKPFGRDRLRDAVVAGMEWHRTARSSRLWREKLEAELDERYVRLIDTIGSLGVESDRNLEQLLTALAEDRRDGDAHARRVAALAVSVAQAIGLSNGETVHIRQAALLHDIGKLALPEALLRKPAPLTPDEQAIVRRHPQLGSELIGTVPCLDAAAAIVRDVQERPDGRGYPAGLCGADLSMAARIIAAVDAYDTMIRDRAYRAALTATDALLELDRCSGTQFDPYVVHVLKTLVAIH